MIYTLDLLGFLVVFHKSINVRRRHL
jgi:hypothetical protein